MLCLQALSFFLAVALAIDGPSVQIQNGTVVGSSSGGVDSFLGIPYAQPPVGDGRLRAPQPLTQPFGALDATHSPASCPQFLIPTNTSILEGLPLEVVGYLLDSPFFQKSLNESEDCLTLSIMRPSNATSSSKLPVVFWIYGGGFEFGSTPLYNGTGLVKRSMSLGADIIFVAVSYRVGGFGFLAGRELQQDGNTNLGLRDQRLGLEWVADNIAAFGGDPSRVTIWGESAGSISVYDHLLINSGDNTYNGRALFHGAIMDSGNGMPSLDVASQPAQQVYDNVVSSAGCENAPDTLACLRQLPYEKFLNAANSVPSLFSYSGVFLSYMPRPDPNSTFFPIDPAPSAAASMAARVPLIIGDQEDEGTIFALPLLNISTNDQVIDYFSQYYPLATRAQVADFVNTYPQDPAAGSPYGTGDLNEISPQYKRLAAILGDYLFIMARRASLNAFKTGNPSIPVWSYLGSWLNDLPVLGTCHATDIAEIFVGGVPFKSPRNAFYNKFISFFNYLEPNHFDATTGDIEWPEWTNQTLSLFHILADSNGITTDNFRQASYEYFDNNQGILKV